MGDALARAFASLRKANSCAWDVCWRSGRGSLVATPCGDELLLKHPWFGDRAPDDQHDILRPQGDDAVGGHRCYCRNIPALADSERAT